MPRCRIIIREALFFFLGSSLVILCRRPDVPSLTSNLVVVDIPAPVPDAIHATQADLQRRRTEAAAAASAAQCSAVLRECRAAVRREKEEKRRTGAKKEEKKPRPNTKVHVSSTKGGSSLRPDTIGLGDSKQLGLFKPRIFSQMNCTKLSTAMDPCFPNRAIKDEMQRHDRWVVDSLAYLQTFTGEGENEALHQGGKQVPDITLAVLTINRSVPYLAVLMTTLLRGHDPATLEKYLDLHVINIERRPCRCRNSLLRDLEERLPFVTFHDWTLPYPQHANITDSNLLYKSNQRLDYIRSLELCIEKKSKWCWIFEDDAAMTKNVIPKFLHLTAAINMTSLAILSLYVPYNDAFAKDKRILVDKYVRENYDEDAKALKFVDPDTKSPRIRYQINDLGKLTYGVVANAYPSNMLRRIVSHLSKEYSWNTTHFTDIEVMKFFVADNHLRKVGVNPSLVNHVGHYSEHRKEGRMFRWMSTDVRFQLDG